MAVQKNKILVVRIYLPPLISLIFNINSRLHVNIETMFEYNCLLHVAQIPQTISFQITRVKDHVRHYHHSASFVCNLLIFQSSPQKLLTQVELIFAVMMFLRSSIKKMGNYCVRYAVTLKENSSLKLQAKMNYLLIQIMYLKSSTIRFQSVLISQNTWLPWAIIVSD